MSQSMHGQASTPGLPILVTGASGYLASWIVAQLLESGHRVHATVRDVDNTAKCAHLHALQAQYPGDLQLFEADLGEPGSFDAAMQGCGSVIHTASPYFLDMPKDIEASLLRPAVEGTRAVLDAVDRTASVRRVVLTSSIVALYEDARSVGVERGHTVRESDINPQREPRDNPYAYSKTAAERLAWEMERAQTRWSLLTIHPGAIFGPSLSRRADPTSVAMLLGFLKGTFRSGVPALWLGVVDVRDAARAHVVAATDPRAHGRYLAVAASLRLIEIARLLRVKAFGLPDRLPRGEAPKLLIWLIAPLVGLRRRFVSRNVGHPLYFDGKRLTQELDMVYRDAANTFDDHLRQVVADGLVASC
ncbi:NAD-dependent epimerase/dehydratase family protein [Niveibacterium sp. SC-1]|uniref:NAD-dependent epimerase/dehydratase family protein n=1 Tax=Niveibacterium sp. SC-1 TaxID=3135646 RepID=UPI00311EF490